MVKTSRTYTTRSATSTTKDKATIKYPCGLTACGKGAVKEGIKCDACSFWYHNRCSGLGIRAISLYTEHSFLKWICSKCIQRIKNAQIIPKCEEIGVQVEEVDMRLSSDTTQEGSVPLALLSPVDGEAGEGFQSRGKEDTSSCPKDTAVWRTVDRRRKVEVGKSVTQRKAKTGIDSTKRYAKKNNHTHEGLSDLEEVKIMLKEQQSILSTLQKEGVALSLELRTLKTQSDIALGRNRNVVIRGIPEPYMRESRQRDRAMRYHVNNLLRTANVPLPVTIKRVLRLGRWAKDQPPRPVVAEFANPRTRDRFLAAAGQLNRETEGRVTVEPDNSAEWRHSHRTGDTLVRKDSPTVMQKKSPILVLDKLSGLTEKWNRLEKEPRANIPGILSPNITGKDGQLKKVVPLDRIRHNEGTQDSVLVGDQNATGEGKTVDERVELGSTKTPGGQIIRKAPQPKNGTTSRA